MARNRTLRGLIAMVAVAIVVGACGSAGTPTPTSTPASTPAPTQAVILDAPAEVTAGSDVVITWTATDGPGDYLVIVPAGAQRINDEPYVDVSRGNPATLTAPTKPGSYEILYIVGDTVDQILARRPITVQ